MIFSRFWNLFLMIIPSHHRTQCTQNFLTFTHFRMSTPHKFILNYFSFLYRCNSLFIGLFFLIAELIVMLFQGRSLRWEIILNNFQYLYLSDTFCIKKNNRKKNHQLIKDYSMYQSLNQMKYTVPLYWISKTSLFTTL